MYTLHFLRMLLRHTSHSFFLRCRQEMLLNLQGRKKVEVNVTGLSKDFSLSNVQGMQVSCDPRSQCMRLECATKRGKREDAAGIHNKYLLAARNAAATKSIEF